MVGRSAYYSVTAPATQSYNGYNWVFLNWSATNGTYFQNPTADTTAVVFGGSGSVISANYKGTHLSNDASAFSNNSQRKFVETPDGIMWQTYTSVINGASHVFLEYSSNGGTTWQIMKTYLGSLWLDWTGQGKCPSLDWWDTGAGYYAVTVVFQEPSSGGNYEIDYVIFMRQPGSGVYIDNYQGIIYQEPVNGDSYSVNANPAIAFGIGSGSEPSFVVAFERKSLSNSGINLKWGYMSYPGLSVTGGYSNPMQVTSTNASSCHPTICSDRTASPPFFNLAYEQDVSQYTSTIQYTALGLSSDYSQCSQNYSYRLSNSSYTTNVRPCITGLNGYFSGNTYVYGPWYASWLSQPNPSIAAKCAYTNINTNTIWYYGISVSSASINVSNDNSTVYVAWNSIYSHANQLVNTVNVNNVANLNTSGLDIQMSNGPTKNDMRVSSYYDQSSSPYYWNTSQALGTSQASVTTQAPGMGNAGLDEVSSGASAVAWGRGCTVNFGNANFLYNFGDLNVDGQNVEFVDLPNSAKFTSMDSINDVLLTQPFSLTKESKVVFTETSGFADSSASINVLGKLGFVGYRIDLVDAGTNEVIGTLENSSMTASNLRSTEMTGYLLNTKNIKSGTYRIKVIMSTDLDSAKFSLAEYRSLQNLATSASSTESLTMQQLDIVTTYALAQNYPNPFNPSTTINYQLPVDGHVTLKVYDILGREVRTLVDEAKDAGSYEVKFDAGNLASGVYFYRVSITADDGTSAEGSPQAGKNFVSTKKMLILK